MLVGARISVVELCAIAKPKLDIFNSEIMPRINSSGNPNPAIENAKIEMRGRLDQRVSNAMQDVEVGFIGGSAVTILESKQQQTKAARLLQAIYDHGKSDSTPIFATELGVQLGMSATDTESAWRYLRDKSLIETFNLPYAARINAKGTDAIEDARKHPDQPIQAFPFVTLNIVNIGTANNSSIQQAGS